MNKAQILVKFLSEHQSFSDEERQKRLETILDDQRVVVIQDVQDKITGIVEIKRFDNFVHGASAHITLASHLDEESLKRASHELDVQLNKLKEDDVNMVMMGVNVDQLPIHSIIKNGSFKPWYGYVFMRHSGTIPHATKLHKREIEMQDFEMYMKTMSACFTDMRQAMDIRPHPVIEALWRDQTHKENNKDEWFKHRELTWMYYDQGNWVGSGLLYKEDIDDVFVPIDQQGKGYGRAIVEDLIYEAYQRNIQPYIGYVKWNHRAGRLYESLGFKAYLELQYYRVFLKD